MLGTAGLWDEPSRGSVEQAATCSMCCSSDSDRNFGSRGLRILDRCLHALARRPRFIES